MLHDKIDKIIAEINGSLMERGEKEQKCLDFVKKDIFTNNGEIIRHPFTRRTYSEVSDEEFIKEQEWFINSECIKNFFGLQEEERNEIEQILRMARCNSNLNDFPDFVFKNGFIEHFQITSSKFNKKGADHARKESDFQRTVANEVQELERSWNIQPSFEKVRSKSWVFQNPKHSHEFLIASFKHNWEHHMKSYKNYSGEKEIGIFMVEYPEIALAMIENVYCNWLDGMSHGDMRKPEKYKEYRLSRDRRLLEYIYDYKNEIKYVIFINRTRYEIVYTENIPYLLKLMPWEYIIDPMEVAMMRSISNVSIPAKGKENET